MKRQLLALVTAVTLFGLTGCDNSTTSAIDQTNASSVKIASSQSASSQSSQTNSTVNGTANATQPSSALSDDMPSYMVGITVSLPPFVKKDAVGNPEGFDIDVLNAIGEVQGFKLIYHASPWKDVLNQLTGGRYDIIATGVVITPERESLYDFSNPYADTQWAALLSEKNTKKFNSFSEALDASTVIATQKGTASVEVLQKEIGEKPIEIKTVDTQFQEITTVAGGEADMSYNMSRVMTYYANLDNIKKEKLYVLVDEDSVKQDIGFVFKKDREDGLKEKIDEGLATIKANGTYAKLETKWFGSSS